MPSIIDYTSHDFIKKFPWESVLQGMAWAEKTVTTFNVGEIQLHGLENVRLNMRPTDKRWYLALKHGYVIEGFNVNVTEPKSLPTPWFQTGNSSFWQPSKNAQYFKPLLDWINASGMFSEIGRVVFFITLPGQFSPSHVDYVHNDLQKLPQGASPSEFLWITPPENPKQLIVGTQEAPWACSFNPFVEHYTNPSTRTQWSLRIDGVYS
jgi:hypothetical protein